MNTLTQIGLLDDCIDGDKERLDALLGNMYDHFYCFYRILTQMGEHQQIPVVFSAEDTSALFECPPNLPVSTQLEEIEELNCKVSVHSSKKKTNIRIEKKHRKGR